MNLWEPGAFDWALSTYWDYYVELENELLETRRYVAFSESNFNTYSIEMLKLLEAVCSEVDVLLKVLAVIADRSFDTSASLGIHKSWYAIQDQYRYSLELNDITFDGYPRITSSLMDATCRIGDTLAFKPWANYAVEQRTDRRGRLYYRLKSGMSTPKWWSDYNKVKHGRAVLPSVEQSGNYSRANLGNVLSAFAGLHVLEKALLRRIGSRDDHEGFIDDSVLFTGRNRALTSRDIDNIVRSARKR